MILIDGVEYKGNLKLKSFGGKHFKNTPTSNTSYMLFVHNEELYNISSDGLYKYIGNAWERTGDGIDISSASSPRYRAITYNGELYLLNNASLENTTSVGNYDSYHVTFNPLTYTSIGGIRYNEKINGTTYRHTLQDAEIFNNTIYLLIDNIPGGSSGSQICTLNINTCETTLVLSCEEHLISLKSLNNKLYATNEGNNSISEGSSTQPSYLYKIENQQLVKLANIPFYNFYNSSSSFTRPYILIYKNNLYVYYKDFTYYSDSYYKGGQYLWKFNKDETGYYFTKFAPSAFPDKGSGSYAWACIPQELMNPSFIMAPGNGRYLFVYNDAIRTHGFYYNEDEHEWMRTGEYYCKIDNQT